MTNELNKSPPAHTPGPWKLFEEHLGIHFGPHQGGIHLHKDTPNSLANARLIAAAPDLLFALEIILDCERNKLDSASWYLGKEAVAKARGQA
jgi:hypothetical protein